MLEIRDQYRPEQETDYYFNFGFFQAMAVQQLLEHAVELGDLGRDGIITAMNDLDALQFNGLMGDYTYGAPEDRDPSRQSSLFSINMSMPFGLEGLRTNFTTDAASAFEFVEQEL